MDNLNPSIVQQADITRDCLPSWNRDFVRSRLDEKVDALEVFEWLRCLRDPEYPLTLEELKVVSYEDIKVTAGGRCVEVVITPTVPHCSQATLIGLMIKAVLLWVLPLGTATRVRIAPGTHTNEVVINKQLADKERVSAALEAPGGLSKMIVNGVNRTRTLENIVISNVSFDSSGDNARDTTFERLHNSVNLLDICADG